MLDARRTPFTGLIAPLLLVNAAVLALCGALYLGLAAPIKSNTLEGESRRLDIYRSLISGDVEEVISDLRLLATDDGITDYLQTANPAELDRAVRRAVFISKDNPDYDQVRYIDENGREVFRVNRNGAVVPPSQLQNKFTRPFFQKANALAPGEIYVSPLDLNVDNGVIARPLKPALRLAIPLFDSSNRHRGIYVINLLAENLIDQLRRVVPRRSNRLRLLNPQGYWLAGPSPDVEWGFNLPSRAGDTLARTDPALWARVQAEPTGQASYQGGYFTWARVDTRDFARGKPLKLVSDEDYIVLASVISADEWNDLLAQLRETFVVVALLLVILASFATRFFQMRRWAQAERDRFFNLTRDMLCITGFDGCFRRLNPAWYSTLGYKPEDLIGQPFLAFVHPADQEKTVRTAARLTQGSEIIGFENRYRCKDGTYRWLLWSSRPLPEEKIVYSSARDLTERKQIEQKLQASEERIRLMLESLKDYSIFMLAPDGTVMNWNSSAERIHGYTATEIVGQHFSRFHPPENPGGLSPTRQLEIAAGEGHFADEGWRVRRDGSRFWANVVITPMRDHLGQLIGFVKVTRDVTARKEAAERIEKLNGELKSRAELLEAANKELESFSYSVSHDLRAPLRHIHGFVEILQQSPLFRDQDAAQRQMEVIARAAREMGLLIDDLLDFSRTGRAEMRFTPVDMGELVDQCIRSLEMDTAGRRVTWEVGPLAPVEADPSLLRMVWNNLIGNAVKYTRPRAEAKIEIGQQPPANGGAERVYFIRDNGVGFDMRYAAKLFGVFQRLHRAEDFEGTGIGLANVQRIIHRHGGKIWAESQVDAGATFYFSLPLRAVPPANLYVNGKAQEDPAGGR
jgi:PAS domain S-box-containing protein